MKQIALTIFQKHDSIYVADESKNIVHSSNIGNLSCVIILHNRHGERIFALVREQEEKNPITRAFLLQAIIMI